MRDEEEDAWDDQEDLDWGWEEEVGAAERLFAQLDARGGEEKLRRVHSLALGSDVDAAFTISRGAFYNAIRVTRLGGKKERVFYLTPISLHLLAVDGDFRVSVEVPVIDIYLREGLESFSFQFQKSSLNRYVTIRRTNSNKTKHYNHLHENLYFILKVKSGYLEMHTHMQDDERRKGKQSLVNVASEIKLDERGLMRYAASPSVGSAIKKPPEATENTDCDAPAMAVALRIVTSVIDVKKKIITGINKNYQYVKILSGEIIASQDDVFCFVKDKSLENLDFSVKYYDISKLIKLLRRCSAPTSVFLSEKSVVVISGPLTISFPRRQNESVTSMPIKTLGATVASTKVNIESVIRQISWTRVVLPPRLVRKKSREPSMNISMVDEYLRVSAITRSGVSYFAFENSIIQKNPEFDGSTFIRAISLNVLQRFFKCLSKGRMTCTMYERPVMSFECSFGRESSEVKVFLSAKIGGVRILDPVAGG